MRAASLPKVKCRIRMSHSLSTAREFWMWIFRFFSLQ